MYIMKLGRRSKTKAEKENWLKKFRQAMRAKVLSGTLRTRGKNYNSLDRMQELIIEKDTSCFNFNSINFDCVEGITDRTDHIKNYLAESEAGELEQVFNGSQLYINPKTKDLYVKYEDKYIYLLEKI